jgi:hypothetical protein
MSFGPLMPIVMASFYRSFLARLVYSFHLAMCPRMLDLDQTVRNALFWLRMWNMAIMQAAAGPSVERRRKVNGMPLSV